MPAPETLQSSPYEITPRVWRDEQPGDDPRLVVSVTFVPRTSATDLWRDVRLAALDVRAGEQRWSPRESSVAPFGGDGFEVKALGDATLPAGAAATLRITLHTSAGEKQVDLAVEVGRVG